MDSGEKTSSTGTVNGLATELFVDHVNFSWIQREQSDVKSKDSPIPIKSIIALTQAKSRSPNEFNVLYVLEEDTTKDDSKSSSLSFNSLAISKPPQQLLDRFQVKDQSPWYGRREQPSSSSIIYVIVSTGSGTGLALRTWEQLVQPLLDSIGFEGEIDYQLHLTQSESSVAELIEGTILPNSNKGIAQSIILLSGDGGVLDIVNTLLFAQRSDAFKKPTISLLLLGTGNALANSSGITGDSTMGLRTMLLGSPREVPLFRATFSHGAKSLINEGREERDLQASVDGMRVAYGAVVCSWGHHAALVADSDTAEYRKFGSERFSMAAKEALFPSDGSPPHAYKGKVSIKRPGRDEWELIPRDLHGYILATLVSQLEAGLTISPASQPLDGKLRLVHFGDISGEDAMGAMTKAFDGGKHVEDENIGYEEITGLRIEFDEDDGRWRRVCVDGKIVRVEKGGWVEVGMGVEGVVDLISWK